jgi:putative transposase
VLEEVQAWQARPLDAVYPILYFDCLFVKSRQEGPIRNKAVYLAPGINLQREKELLGLWTKMAVQPATLTTQVAIWPR